MKFSWMIIFLLISSFVIAPEEWDYFDSNIYDLDDFYSSDVDWNEVNWEDPNLRWDLLNYNDPEIYTAGFYDNLPEEAYSYLDYSVEALDYNQIDHSLINREKYLADLGCSGCDIDYSGSANPIYSGVGIENQNRDNFVSVPGNFPEGTIFSVTVEDILVILPESASSFEIYSHLDAYTLNVDNNHPGVLLDWNNNFRGTLYVDQNQYYLDPEFPAYINGWKVTEVSGSSPSGIETHQRGLVAVHFGREEHEGNYITFDGDDFVAGRGVGIQSAYISGQTADLLGRYDEDKILQISSFEAFTLERREGLIPLLQMENGALYNGHSVYDVEDGRFYHLGFFEISEEDNSFISLEQGYFLEDDASYPLTLLVTDENGENALEVAGEEQKIIFGGNGNYRFVAADENPETSECLGCQDDFPFYRTYSRGDNEEVELRYLARGTPTYLDLPPEFRDLDVPVYIVPEEEIGLACGGPSNVIGCYKGRDNFIIIRSDRINNEELLHHELAHAWQSAQDARFDENLEGAIYYLIETQELVGTLSEEERGLLEDEARDIAFSEVSDFTDEWLYIAYGHSDEDPYVQHDENDEVSERGSDESPTAPHSGVLTRHGQENEREDFAEYMEAINSWSDEQWQEAFATGDARIFQKLELIHRYGLVDDEDYERILRNINEI